MLMSGRLQILFRSILSEEVCEVLAAMMNGGQWENGIVQLGQVIGQLSNWVKIRILNMATQLV